MRAIRLLFTARARRKLRALGACPIRAIITSDSLKTRARGTPDARCVRSLACKMKKHTSDSHNENTGCVRRSARDGSDAYCVLPPVTGPCCHRSPGYRLPPSRPVLAAKHIATTDRKAGPAIGAGTAAPGRFTHSASARGDAKSDCSPSHRTRRCRHPRRFSRPGFERRPRPSHPAPRS